MLVGLPLPDVTVKLVDDSGNKVIHENKAGEIYVHGPQVFKELSGLYMNLHSILKVSKNQKKKTKKPTTKTVIDTGADQMQLPPR